MDGLKTSQEWYNFLFPNQEVKIIDADGWNSRDYDYCWGIELISEHEFHKRLASSTISVSIEFLTKNIKK